MSEAPIDPACILYQSPPRGPEPLAPKGANPFPLHEYRRPQPGRRSANVRTGLIDGSGPYF
jgi:hypothetical protein